MYRRLKSKSVPFLGTAFGEPLSDGKIQFLLRARQFFFWNSLLLSDSLFASTEKVHRPRSQSPLQSDIGNSQRIRTPKWFSF